VHGGHDLPQDIDRQHGVSRMPVGNDLGPAGSGCLICCQRGQLVQPGTPAPAVEKLAMLSDPRPGVHCPRNIVITAKPAGWIAGETRRPDQRDTGSHMLVQVLAQHRFIQRLAPCLGSGMGVRINQTRQQPALSHQLSAGDRIGGPPVTRGVQVDNVLAGQCDTPDSDDWHTASLPGASAHDQPGNARLPGAPAPASHGRARA
jgi:hypothetical protein